MSATLVKHGPGGSVVPARRSATHIRVAAAIVVLLLVFLTGLILANFAHDSDRISEDRMQLMARYGEGMRMLIGETLVNCGTESLPIMLKNLTPAGSSISSAVLDQDYRILFASQSTDRLSQHLSSIVQAMPSAGGGD